MLPIRWDPIRDLNSLQRELDDVMRRVFGTSQESTGLQTATPAINTFVKDRTFHPEAALPGLDTDKLDVPIDGNHLVSKGERRVSKKTEESDFLIHEARMTSFERSLTLPEGVDAEKAHASYKDGLLEVTMPIAQKEPGGRKILVEGLEAGKKSKEIH